MARIPILFRLFSAVLLLLPLQAQDQETPLGLPKLAGKPATVATLVPEVAAIAPGAPFTVGLRLVHPTGWHSYYQNSGGVELPVRIEWTLPDGFSAGPIRWPVPEVEEGLFGKSFAYSGSPVFLIEITPPATLEPGDSVELMAIANWQICKPGRCEDETEKFNLILPVETEAKIDSAQAELFADSRGHLPKHVEGWGFSAENAGPRVKLRIAPPGGVALPEDLDFIPADPFLASLSQAGTVAQEGDEWVITLPRVTENPAGIPIEQGQQVSGILISKSPLDAASGASALAVPPVPIERAPAKPLALSALLPVLGGMLLGGLILNLMPCVFPVIGLKIMGFVQQAGEDRKKIILHGLAFTGGVLISFWILSGLLFALRSAAGPGQEIGWGYQLQNPWIVLFLMLLMFVLALAMYGVFEIGASATGIGGKLQSKQGVSGSFFSGILATVVATPCSAPFLGAAIGIAIALPAAQFFTAFTAMALGLALPYLLLSIFPKLVDFLPRPGPWMESFKQAMAFLLFATAGYLLWVYAAQIGYENMPGVIFGLTAIAIAAWIFGRWFTPVRGSRARTIAVIACVAFAAAGLKLSIPAKSSLVWEKWSDERVAELLEEGTPVFVDFTAQWCATCQFNKSRAYPEEVARLIESRGIVLLKGDKTSPDPEIDAKLEELGRSAIPVNVLYVPEKDPIITPEVLSEDYMKDLIEKEVPAPAE